MRERAIVPASEPPRQLFVVVECGSISMRMRLAPVAFGERFAAENGRYGILPIELIGDRDDDSLAPAFHVFRQLEKERVASDGATLEGIFDAWGEGLASRGLDLRLERRSFYGAPLPPNSRGLDGGRTSLRPWDIELTAIEAELRRAVKLDRLPPAYVDEIRANVLRRGLLVDVVSPSEPTPDGAVTMIVARDRPTLSTACELERALLVRGGAQVVNDASAKMGELLGYPSCCTARFSRVLEHNDTNLAWALLPARGEPVSPITQWLQPGLALLSHSPCALSCAASLDLGGRLLDAIDDKEPGLAERWRGVATRVQVVDRYGNRVAVAVEGSLDSPREIEAAELLGSGGSDPDAVDRVQGLVGRELCANSEGVWVADTDWYAAYVADHRDRPPA